MKEIKKWYADKIGKTHIEFDAIDKHIETVIQTWEKEREQVLSTATVGMNIYTEKAKQIYNKVCDKYEHHWLNTTVSQTMAMEMITKALSIANVSQQRELLISYIKKLNENFN